MHREYQDLLCMKDFFNGYVGLSENSEMIIDAFKTAFLATNKFAKRNRRRQWRWLPIQAFQKVHSGLINRNRGKASNNFKANRHIERFDHLAEGLWQLR